jgi:hypothetical protein
MGRYRGHHRYKKNWRKKKNNNGDETTYDKGMADSDAILVTKYLSEYRSTAYAILNESQQQYLEGALPYTIGNHVFAALTEDVCKQPYIELPDSLSSKERKHIHAICSSLDLYHCGAGSQGESKNEPNTKKRRIVVSIFANGLDYVNDIESPTTSNKASYPSHRCRAWYNSACSAMKLDVCSMNSTQLEQFQMQSMNENGNNDNSYVRRVFAIQEEKKLISQFVKYPEQSLRTSLRRDAAGETSQQIDTLDLGALESMDLSIVPTPKQCPWMLVDTVAKLKDCVKELKFGLSSKPKNSSETSLLHELAFDLEMYDHSGGEKKSALRTCLIQLTSNVATKDYVIDPLAPEVWNAIPVFLGPLFSDSNIVKIGHGICGMDTTSLHRDFGIVVVNAFDTYEASAVLASRRQGGLGLALLCKYYGLPSWEEYAELKKKYQASNWSVRPLDEEALEYGRFDVRCLIMLRKLLMRDLVNLDMIGGKNPFDYIQRRVGTERKSDVLSIRASSVDSSNESLTAESSLSCEGSSSIDPYSYSEPSSFDEFQDAMDSIHVAQENDDGTADEFLDARETSSPAKQCTHLLQASDLPSFHHLMQAIKISQKRCLSLWAGEDKEHILTHPALLRMIQHCRTGNGYGRFWTDAHYKLYLTLTNWRQGVAERQGIDPYEVCSLDFLVYAAYKLPLDRYEMRRFTYFLPDMLEDDSLPFYEEICELITSSEVYGLLSQPPLSEMERSSTVLFCEDERKRPRRKKVIVGAAVVGIATILLIRKARRK